MRLKDVELTPNQISRWLGCSTASVYVWLRSGKILGEHDGKHHVWIIRGSSFETFLYSNPRYLKEFKEAQLPSIYQPMREIILFRLGALPELIDRKQLEDMFMVTRQCARRWIKKRIFVPCGVTVSGFETFSHDKIQEGLNREPRLKERLRKNYTEYDRRDALRYL